MSEPRSVWPLKAQLGEGVIWSSRDNTVWCVDILGHRIHQFCPESNHLRTWATPTPPGFICLLNDSEYLVGLADGLYRFDPVSGGFDLVVEAETGRPENRLNDGTIGPDGALWFGTKNNKEDKATGAWHRWDGKGHPQQFDSGYTVTNGPAFSLSGDTIFFCDSTEQRIYRRSTAGNGQIGEKQLFVQVAKGEGYPDGLAIDDEDCLWVALYAGHAVRRYDPNGKLLEQIDLPCSNVTKPAFGGKDRSTLFVTTAAAGLNEQEKLNQPEAGNLYAIELDVAGPTAPSLILTSGR